MQSHERVAAVHGDAGGVGLDDERADAAVVSVGLRDARHHDEQVGDDPVGGPQLGAVEHVRRVILGRHRGGTQPGGVGADLGLGQQEGADRAVRAARQVPALLLLRAREHERLGQADGLVRRQQRADTGVHRPDHHERAVVVVLPEPEAAVLHRDLHPERADLGERLEGLVGDARLPLDARDVDPSQERLERREEPLAALAAAGVGSWMRMDQRQVELSQVEAPGEARLPPVLLARRLGDGARLLLADLVDVGDGGLTGGAHAPSSLCEISAPDHPGESPPGPSRASRYIIDCNSCVARWLSLVARTTRFLDAT